jgi:hypothetical protein
MSTKLKHVSKVMNRCTRFFKDFKHVLQRQQEHQQGVLGSV